MVDGRSTCRGHARSQVCDRRSLPSVIPSYVQTSMEMEYSGASNCGICLMSSWSRSIDHAALTVREGAVSPGISAREPLRNYFAQIAVVFLVYVVAGKLGQATTSIRSSNLGPVWPAYGVAVAAILIWGYHVWLGIAAGAFVVAFFSPVPHIAALGQATGATLAAMTGAFLLHHVANFHRSLSRLSDVLGLIVFGAWGSALVSASIGLSVLYASHVHAYSGLGGAWLIYWLGDATGVLLVTPLALTFANFLKLRDRHRIAELAVLLVLLTITCLIVFSDWSLVPVRLHFMAFAVLPFVLWAAIDFGMSGTTLSVFIVATVATLATAYGFGPFAQDTPFTNAVLLDIFFAVLSVSGMALAAVVSERENLLRNQAAIEARLRLAAIVESSDDAIMSVDTDGIITDWNKGAERLYGYTETEAIGLPLASLVPSNLLDEENDILQRSKAGERIEHYETIRVTKSGKNVDVSLTISPLRDSAGRIVGASKIARNITEQKRVAEAVRESEERLHLAAQAGRMYAYEWDVATDMVVRSPEYLNILGLRKEPIQLTRQQLLERVHPDDSAKFIAAGADVTPENPKVQLTYRVQRPDGSVIWLEKNGRAFFDDNGKMVRMIGMVADVTERKLAEDALSTVSARLIQAQEQERSRIGRELHDDINQRLALLAIELERLQTNAPNEFGTRIAELRHEALEISTSVQSMSHDLHSSKLEYLGLERAARIFLREFGERENVEVDFKSYDVPGSLPSELSLSLFRVLQEALHNAAKHSGVKHVDVQLWGTSGKVNLTVSDLGLGFNTEATMHGTGLGLTSMRERMRLLGGELSINSEPRRGTTIHARVPFDSSRDSAKATG
jgi:PAS domain S-box-containing protein